MTVSGPLIPNDGMSGAPDDRLPSADSRSLHSAPARLAKNASRRKTSGRSGRDDNVVIRASLASARDDNLLIRAAFGAREHRLAAGEPQIRPAPPSSTPTSAKAALVGDPGSGLRSG